MSVLINFYWYGLLIALGLGLLTGLWIWGFRPAAMPIELGPDDELIDWRRTAMPPPPEAPLATLAADRWSPAIVTAPEELASDRIAPDQADSSADMDAPEAASLPDMEEVQEPEQPMLVVEPSAESAPLVIAEPEPTPEPDVLGLAIAAATPIKMPDAVAEPASEPEMVVPETEPDQIAESEPDNAPDDLMMIKGIGPELDALLRSLSIQRFGDIAGWMPEDIERIDGQLGTFKGRILRDEWIGQARLLARGEMDLFNQRYGHLS
jgi:predicted flap endonuclease-1-like 5' DNA nuclease